VNPPGALFCNACGTGLEPRRRRTADASGTAPRNPSWPPACVVARPLGGERASARSLFAEQSGDAAGWPARRSQEGAPSRGPAGAPDDGRIKPIAVRSDPARRPEEAAADDAATGIALTVEGPRAQGVPASQSSTPDESLRLVPREVLDEVTCHAPVARRPRRHLRAGRLAVPLVIAMAATAAVVVHGQLRPDAFDLSHLSRAASGHALASGGPDPRPGAMGSGTRDAAMAQARTSAQPRTSVPAPTDGVPGPTEARGNVDRPATDRGPAPANNEGAHQPPPLRESLSETQATAPPADYFGAAQTPSPTDTTPMPSPTDTTPMPSPTDTMPMPSATGTAQAPREEPVRSASQPDSAPADEPGAAAHAGQGSPPPVSQGESVASVRPAPISADAAAGVLFAPAGGKEDTTRPPAPPGCTSAVAALSLCEQP
jgi:hypothetical protein